MWKCRLRNDNCAMFVETLIKYKRREGVRVVRDLRTLHYYPPLTGCEDTVRHSHSSVSCINTSGSMKHSESPLTLMKHSESPLTLMKHSESPLTLMKHSESPLTLYALMNRTKTGKNMEGGVVLEFSPKYSTAESYTSWKTHPGV